VALQIATGIGKAAALERVLSGDADVAFVQLPLDADRVKCDVLGETEIVLVANRNTVVPADLRQARFIVWDGSPEAARLLEARPEYRRIASTNDLGLIKRLLDADLGLAFVPRWAIHAELRSEALHVVASPFPTIRQRFGVAYRDDARRATVDAFLGAAHDYRATIAALCVTNSVDAASLGKNGAASLGKSDMVSL
jgi:DNA-binding transcriptional LysR family regulator